MTFSVSLWQSEQVEVAEDIMLHLCPATSHTINSLGKTNQLALSLRSIVPRYTVLHNDADQNQANPREARLALRKSERPREYDSHLVKLQCSALKSNGSKKCVARGLPATSNTVNKHATAERKLVAVLATIIVTLWRARYLNVFFADPRQTPAIDPVAITAFLVPFASKSVDLDLLILTSVLPNLLNESSSRKALGSSEVVVDHAEGCCQPPGSEILQPRTAATALHDIYYHYHGLQYIEPVPRARPSIGGDALAASRAFAALEAARSRERGRLCCCSTSASTRYIWRVTGVGGGRWAKGGIGEEGGVEMMLPCEGKVDELSGVVGTTSG
ncbi:hypothetical protein BDR05DRAFT_992934 [Suillus weaverae]|nr:hypothetical protein BDR05DRAFT_992934 [Suillus weaverae]